jgi:hypothetical protein
MAQLAVIVMCRSERPPPDATCSLASSATKSPPTQKAAYVSGHISCEFEMKEQLEKLVLHMYRSGIQ